MLQRAKASGGRLRTIQGTWLSTCATLGAAIVVLMVVSAVLAERDRDRYRDMVADIRAETGSLAHLERMISETVEPVSGVLYGGRAPGDEREDYSAAGRAVVAAFEHADASMHNAHERELLGVARTTWSEIDAAVRASVPPSEEQVLRGFRDGVDPHSDTVWERYKGLDAQVADVRAATVQDITAELHGAERTGRIVIAMYLGVVLIAIAAMVLTGRRMARTVVGPLRALGRSAEDLSAGGSRSELELPGAVEEVQHLAAALDFSARSLERTTTMLRAQAGTDPLTLLPNRASFMERLERATRSLGAGHPEAAVLFVDLDDFKDVNDTRGHAVGDELLRTVAARMRAAVRDDEIVARLGGDEFAILTCGPTSASVAISIAERILDVMRHPVCIDGTELTIGCSVGIATSGEGSGGSADAQTLLAHADFAMYMAKGQGKNRYEIHSPAMHAEMLARTELRRSMPQALEREEFLLHYQPIVDLGSNRLLGYEALLRWQRDSGEVLGPDRFISVAEESGAIVPIGSWVADEACRTLAALHRQDRRLLMTINVSAKQLAERDFARHMFATSTRHGVATDRIVIEITEETAISDTKAERRTLEDLRSFGFHIALDDFGTGFSSLRYLSELPVDVIKIDRSFISIDKAPMLETIIRLSQDLGLQIIAEGIEDDDDLQRLRGYGPLAGQGYLFAKPMASSDLSTSPAGSEASARTAGDDDEAIPVSTVSWQPRLGIGPDSPDDPRASGWTLGAGSSGDRCALLTQHERRP